MQKHIMAIKQKKYFFCVGVKKSKLETESQGLQLLNFVVVGYCQICLPLIGSSHRVLAMNLSVGRKMLGFGKVREAREDCIDSERPHSGLFSISFRGWLPSPCRIASYATDL